MSYHHSTDSRPILLLGAGAPEFREYVLRQIARVRPVVLVDQDSPKWARPYLAAQTAVDLRDPEAAEVSLIKVADQLGAVGVTTYMEHFVELTARITHQLGLPGNSPTAAAACRDKAITRRLLAEHGVPSASSYLAQDADHGVKIARRLGYPVVVKPRGRAGSAGVLRADSDDDVRAAFHRALVDSVLGLEAWSVTGALVEEYLQGPEISVETVVLAPDQIRIVAVTRKTLGPEPQFQEIGHSVDAADPLLHDSALAGVVTAAVRALRLSRGVLHIELRLTSSGPRVIEVNGRPAGDLIPLLVERATGVNLPQALAVLAAGGTPDLTTTRSEASAIGFMYPEHTGYIEQLDVHGALRHQLWLERLVWTRDLGTQVTAAPRTSIDDRIAHWVVTGPTAADCAKRRDMVADHLSVRVSRPAHTTGCTK
ncbi:ATP-grasp domain-containing protein [Streptomyces fulvoviolaceus]|uniref:ATP-grasp domain-containing protein n=1 Tax=Streptomyces fulvoviolaceus TaxID=285535 RepID=UPI0021C00FE1|nr:ATP-grasp domain-containing protein [Streptomyces fulvoviolaceus]MCT9075232.1 ATP-grasp domain-containing protein [Streptomyces fulvoviolaceus]